MEGTAAITAAAGDAVGGVLLQLSVVIRRHSVSAFRQIIVFIDQADIHSRRTGGTVVAVYTGASDILWRKTYTSEKASEYALHILLNSISGGKEICYMPQDDEIQAAKALDEKKYRHIDGKKTKGHGGS